MIVNFTILTKRFRSADEWTWTASGRMRSRTGTRTTIPVPQPRGPSGTRHRGGESLLHAAALRAHASKINAALGSESLALGQRWHIVSRLPPESLHVHRLPTPACI